LAPLEAIYGLWIAWTASWVAATIWASRTEKRGGIFAEIFFFRVFLYAGVLLLFVFPSGRHEYGQARLWDLGDVLDWLMVAPAAAGLVFCWWARIHLGRLWSDLITRKAGHHVVDTGPYRLVRHPIYLGLIAAALATAIEKGTSMALLGAAIMSLAFYTKARREERFLRRELGEDVYDAYARKTPMLLPLVRSGS
jgi:protein-S-isoprenylcysteine O-methyltransferase Ste14